MDEKSHKSAQSFPINRQVATGFSECANVDKTNTAESSRPYLDKIFRKAVNRSSIYWSQFKVINYTEFKFVIYTIELDRMHRQSDGHWKLNASLRMLDAFGNRVSELIH